MSINNRLIVSDFDGTLLTTKQTVPARVREAIERYVNAGGVFAVCTGRMLASILPQVRALGLKGLVAAYQGTVIADIESGCIVRNGGFTSDQATEICRILEGRGEPINAYADNKMYSTLPTDNKLLTMYQDITGIRANHVSGKMSDYVAQNNLFCQKIVSVIPPERKMPLYEYLVKEIGEKYDVTYSAAVLVEVSPKGDDKGAALKFIAQKYSIPIEKTVAIGDNLNDLPMILAAGTGVAVKNAVEEFKKYADDVCPSCDEGGVADVIEKYGFN